MVDMDAGNTANHINIIGNTVTACGAAGIYTGATGSGCNYFNITNNNCYSNTTKGMELIELFISNVSDNICSSNLQAGIALNTGYRSTVTGNVCYLNTQHGMELADFDYSTISGNALVGNDSGNTQTYDGLKVDANSTGLTISDNIIIGDNTQNYGIYMLGSRSIISGNYVTLNDIHGIEINGVECIVEGNSCCDNGQFAAGTYHEIRVNSGSDGSAIIGNYVNSPGDSSEDGIHLVSGAKEVFISGNFVYKGMGSGICLIDDNDDCCISGNFCYDFDDYGIEITTSNAQRNAIIGNYCLGNDTAAFLNTGTLTYMENNFAGGTVKTSLGWSYSTITLAVAAFDALNVGGWIEVPTGTWSEAVVLDEANLVLRGQGTDSIIDGGTTGHAVSITASDCIVKDLKLLTTAGQANAYDGINNTGANTSIINVWVSSSDRHCIYTNAQSRIVSCKLASADDMGVYVGASGDNTIITSCYIPSAGDDGIYIDTAAEDCVVDSNRITGAANEAIDDDSGTSTTGDNDTT